MSFIPCTWTSDQQPCTGTFVRHANGVWEWTQWRDGKRHGTDVWRRDDGSLLSRTEWVEDENRGPYKSWYIGGALCTEHINDERGKLQISRFFWPCGQLACERPVNTACKWFHPNGRLWVDGLTTYNQDGDLYLHTSWTDEWEETLKRHGIHNESHANDAVWEDASVYSDAAFHQTGLVERLPGLFCTIGKDVTQLLAAYLSPCFKQMNAKRYRVGEVLIV